MCEDEAGRVAYEAACKAWTPPAGIDAQAWDDLPGDLREAWVAAAEAVKRRFGAIY